MKQAGRWLLLAAALVLLPQAAYAQKKKPSKGGNTGTAAAPASADSPPPPANADADADQPAAAPASPDQGATPPAETGGGEAGGLADICQITPDAPQCQAAKEINLNAEANKVVRAEIYAVQQQYVIKAGRFEI